VNKHKRANEFIEFISGLNTPQRCTRKVQTECA
jgi:hypothetical protein